MYSTNPKSPSPKTFTIGTKYIIQLDKIFTLVDFESAQNVFIKQLTSEKNTEARSSLFENLNCQGNWSKVLKFNPFSSYTEAQRNQNFGKDETRTDVFRTFVSSIFGMSGVQRDWPLMGHLSDIKASMPWKNWEFANIFFGLVSEAFG